MKVLQSIIEMAYSQDKAIDIINRGTSVVLEHWLKIQLFPNHKSVKKWNQSISNVFKKYARIKLKGSNKKPSLKKGIEWFFEEGDEAEIDDIKREIKYILNDYKDKPASYDEVALAKHFRKYVIERFQKELNWK